MRCARSCAPGARPGSPKPGAVAVETAGLQVLQGGWWQAGNAHRIGLWPRREGELEKARLWGAELAKTME